MMGKAVTQAVILCGGLGTRLGSLVKDTPKPMLPVGDKPVLEHTILLLKSCGITDIILAAQYKSEVISSYFGDGSRWGVRITVSVEPYPLGTAGPLTLVKDRLQDNFLVLYGDEFIDLDLTRLIRTHQETAAAATILTRPSTHPWDAALIQTDPSGRITELVHEREQGRHYRNLGNGAIYCISKQILKLIPEECKSDFMKDIFPAAIARGLRLQSSVIEPEGFIKDMGTPQGLASVERHIRQRREIEEAHSNPAPINTVFLDRDGVLNEDTDLIKHPDELRILPGVPEAIKLFNDHGIRTVVITNQPVIARGLCNAQTVDEIHMKLKRELAKAGARLDAIYYCPHHPETHHGNGVIELRRACDCRKPNIGMIMQAKEELGLRLGACMMIGDSSVDILTGKRAGLRTVLLQTGKGRITDDAAPDYTFKDLLEAAQAITQAAVTGDAQ